MIPTYVWEWLTLSWIVEFHQQHVFTINMMLAILIAMGTGFLFGLYTIKYGKNAQTKSKDGENKSMAETAREMHARESVIISDMIVSTLLQLEVDGMLSKERSDYGMRKFAMHLGLSQQLLPKPRTASQRLEQKKATEKHLGIKIPALSPEITATKDKREPMPAAEETLLSLIRSK